MLVHRTKPSFEPCDRVHGDFWLIKAFRDSRMLPARTRNTVRPAFTSASRKFRIRAVLARRLLPPSRQASRHLYQHHEPDKHDALNMQTGQEVMVKTSMSSHTTGRTVPYHGGPQRLLLWPRRKPVNLLPQRNELPFPESGGGKDCVYVPGVRISPRTATIERTFPDSFLVQSRGDELAQKCARLLPFPPSHASQLAPQPLVELFKYLSGFCVAEVAGPASKLGFEAFQNRSLVAAIQSRGELLQPRLTSSSASSVPFGHASFIAPPEISPGIAR